MDKISDHISYREAVRSTTDDRLGIENKPGNYELVHMEIIAERIFEPLREWVGGPIRINSFYRGPKLNKAIG